MRTMDFDAVAAAAPLDATAATVRDGSGDHWEARFNATGQAHWETPPRPLFARPVTSMDLAGQRCGRFTVMWFHGATSSKNPEFVWLVRCSCGDYELRRAKTIRKAADPDDCCMKCKVVRTLQQRTRIPSTRKSRAASARALDGLTRRSAP